MSLIRPFNFIFFLFYIINFVLEWKLLKISSISHSNSLQLSFLLLNFRSLLIFTSYIDRQTDVHSTSPLRLFVFLLFYSWHARLPPSDIRPRQYVSSESHLNVESRSVYLHFASCLLVSKGDRIESIELFRHSSTKLNVHSSRWTLPPS